MLRRAGFLWLLPNEQLTRCLSRFEPTLAYLVLPGTLLIQNDASIPALSWGMMPGIQENAVQAVHQKTRRFLLVGFGLMAAAAASRVHAKGQRHKYLYQTLKSG